MFANRLRALRKGKNLTLKKLAKELNQNFQSLGIHYTASQIENWERGTRSPTYRSLSTLAQYFNVTLDYLIGRSFNNDLDLATLLVSNDQIHFDQEKLNFNDRKEIYALISGYLQGKKQRKSPAPSSNQNQLKLNLNNNKD